MGRKPKAIPLQTGIYPVNHKQYDAIPAIRNSYLTQLNKVPAAAAVPVEESPALLFGRALHTFILQRKHFNKEFIVMPEVDGRTKAGKEAKDAAVERAANRRAAILTQEQMRTIRGMRDAIMAHPFASVLISDNQAVERAAVWQDEETGLWCKSLPDLTADSQRAVIDLKSTDNAEENAFLRSVITYGYDRQLAMGCEGLWKATGVEYDAGILIAVEKKPPYRVECYVLDDGLMARGRSEFHRLLRVEKMCRDNNSWPHYQHAGAGVLMVPGWLERWEK